MVMVTEAPLQIVVAVPVITVAGTDVSLTVIVML
jgi:hypothetical protein